MGAVHTADPPAFSYALHRLPPGRLGVRRWRWELWHGVALLAAGWRSTSQDAERALRSAASRRAHELRGLLALRPDRARPLNPFAPGAVVRLDCGALTCLLVPKGEEERLGALAAIAS